MRTVGLKSWQERVREQAAVINAVKSFSSMAVGLKRRPRNGAFWHRREAKCILGIVATVLWREVRVVGAEVGWR